jgi:penicillin-binding protein 2
MRALNYPQRLTLLTLLGACGLLLLVGRLALLQVVEHERWRERADSKRSGWRAVRAVRGSVLGRKGEILAHDAAGFELAVRALDWKNLRHICRSCGAEHFLGKKPPSRCRRCRKGGSDLFVPADRRDLREIARLLGMPEAEIKARLRKQVEAVKGFVAKGVEKLKGRKREIQARNLWLDFGRRPRRILRDVPYEVAREVDLHPDRHPGLVILTSHSRRYPGGRAFAHILGRLRERKIDKKNREKETGEEVYVTRADGTSRRVHVPVGQKGSEFHFEEDLAGRHGWVETERDPRAGRRRVVRQRLPRSGQTLQLTLDRKDQERGASALQDVEGAFVVVEAETGAVRVLATTPSYDPDRYGETVTRWSQLAKDQGQGPTRWVHGTPLIDRAFRSFNAPGSILKPFTAVALLTAGDVTTDELIECRHDFHFRGRTLGYLKCNGLHDQVNLHRGLVKSCNIYFQTLMVRMLDANHFPVFDEVGRSFGFGKPTGIEIQSRMGIPDGWDFYRARREITLVASAIGQGVVSLSAAQIARAYAGLACGSLPRLRIVARIGDRTTLAQRTPLAIEEGILEAVRTALRGVARPGGTAGEHGLDRWKMGCKTGTAQLGMKERDLNNAWMAGFAPAQKGRPAIAFAMVVMRTPFGGGHECGPRLAEFFRYFYEESTQ